MKSSFLFLALIAATSIHISASTDSSAGGAYFPAEAGVRADPIDEAHPTVIWGSNLPGASEAPRAQEVLREYALLLTDLRQLPKATETEKSLNLYISIGGAREGDDEDVQPKEGKVYVLGVSDRTYTHIMKRYPRYRVAPFNAHDGFSDAYKPRENPQRLQTISLNFWEELYQIFSNQLWTSESPFRCSLADIKELIENRPRPAEGSRIYYPPDSLQYMFLPILDSIPGVDPIRRGRIMRGSAMKTQEISRLFSTLTRAMREDFAHESLKAMWWGRATRRFLLRFVDSDLAKEKEVQTIEATVQRRDARTAALGAALATGLDLERKLAGIASEDDPTPLSPLEWWFYHLKLDPSHLMAMAEKAADFIPAPDEIPAAAAVSDDAPAAAAAAVSDDAPAAAAAAYASSASE